MVRPEALGGPIVVAGHACLDITPDMSAGSSIPKPGELKEVGAANISPGGAVPNVGLALLKLGAPARMVALAGDDLFGRGLREQLEAGGADTRLRVRRGCSTSYSVVISPPGIDRSFLHAPAVNHEFDPELDVTDDDLAGAVALHFGYPPAMRRVYADNGKSLAAMFARARARGLSTSLDLCSPDPIATRAIDWSIFFARVLPHVTMFCPSVEELRALLRMEPREDFEDVGELSERALGWGAQTVCIKMGSRGIYLRRGREEIRQACLPARFVNANGAGDCTIAGLLTATLCGYGLAEAARLACTVGACSVESVSATGGVVPWEQVLQRADGVANK